MMELRWLKKLKQLRKNLAKIEKMNFENIGLTVRDMSSKEMKDHKVKNGILISDVKRFSKAENQRLFAGLVITEVNREKINSVSDFNDIIDDKKGEAVLLKVVDSRGTSQFIGIEITE